MEEQQAPLFAHVRACKPVWKESFLPPKREGFSRKTRFTPPSLAHKERERRDSMRSLCSTLFSLVPSEKLPLAECLQQAAKYIDRLRAEVEEAEKQLKEMRSCDDRISIAEEIVWINLNEQAVKVRIRRLNVAHAMLFADAVRREIPLSRLLEVVHCSGSSVAGVWAWSICNYNSITMLLQVCEDFNAGALGAADPKDRNFT